jgi:hypothetical protein
MHYFVSSGREPEGDEVSVQMVAMRLGCRGWVIRDMASEGGPRAKRGERFMWANWDDPDLRSIVARISEGQRNGSIEHGRWLGGHFVPDP